MELRFLIKYKIRGAETAFGKKARSGVKTSDQVCRPGAG
jgi:hypothetical protein